MLGGKWKLLIAYYLLDSPRRNGELRRLLPTLSQKMLTQQLRELEADGIVVRTVHQQVPSASTTPSPIDLGTLELPLWETLSTPRCCTRASLRSPHRRGIISLPWRATACGRLGGRHFSREERWAYVGHDYATPERLKPDDTATSRLTAAEAYDNSPAPHRSAAMQHPRALLALQRTIGNQAVGQALRRAASPVLQRQPDAGPTDAGVPLPGGIPPTPEELEDQRLAQTPPSDLADRDIGPALELAQRQGDQQRYNAILAQLQQRDGDSAGVGVGLPLAMPRGTGGTAMVTPSQALAMLENMLAGQPPFRPELGVGGCSWFVTEGTPYTGVVADHSVGVEAELINTQNAVRYDQARLERIFFEEEARARPEVEAQVRERFQLRTGRDAPTPLSKALEDKVRYQLRKLAERQMWERVGAEIRASTSKVGEVILPGGTPTPNGPPVFSRTPGRFKVIADAAKIRLRGGPMPLVRAIEAGGGGARVAALEGSAAELARTMRLAGKVRTVLRVGGKVLVVVAVAVDLWEIIVAEDHVEATIVSAAGWAGATAGAATFSALWTPADVAGPWAWAAHGVGMLVSGAVGYWIGAETTRYVYRLVVQSRGQIRASP